jgi:catechol 2,3-dioxygenase-like lactoylglutathione lyase family enzyme
MVSCVSILQLAYESLQSHTKPSQAGCRSHVETTGPRISGETMKATHINHVSVRAIDLEESVAFYSDLFGATHIATPNFGGTLAWMQLGDAQIHIFQRGEGWDRDAHFALEVEDFESVYRRARELGAFDDRGNWGHHIFALASGVVQLYVRDPAHNLIEVVWDSLDSLPADIAEEAQLRTDAYEQTEESAKATFFTS